MKDYYLSLSIYGTVESVDADNETFKIRCRSGDQLDVRTGPTTSFTVLTNLDELNRDRLEDPPKAAPGDPIPDPLPPSWYIAKYISVGASLIVRGVYQENGSDRSLEARTVILPHWKKGSFLFEETHWWVDQISLLADKWLDNLFDSTRSYKIDDFSKLYRTNLNITGGSTNNTVQECATLSRLIYGLSSAYLLTGSERYLLAAKAGIDYQREAFRSLSHDGEYCFWAFGRRPGVDGVKLLVPSENEDDRDTIPLYEQIYALAGLAQYYRITQDWEVLEDIRRTINAFLAFYHDDKTALAKGFPGEGGYFSHIDYATMRPDTPGLGHNQSRKNWNSIGDHIPAYLVNLLLALDRPPDGIGRSLDEFLKVCRDILEETSRLIVDKFPDPASDYVNERFLANWIPDHKWRWQQDRAIIGHNLKIAWNLTRVAFYYETLAPSIEEKDQADAYHAHAAKCRSVALDIGKKMADLGLDTIRGGVFDAVERQPKHGMPLQFAWDSTKDFWQQEQGILAYLILHGSEPENPLWLRLARETEMFWNTFFLDRDRQGIFFRTTENGQPEIKGAYANKGAHSVSGYHAFELAYLAHIYTRIYVTNGDNEFCLYFKLALNCEQGSINVLPDFFPPRKIRICRIRVNGIDRTDDLKPRQVDNFQIRLKNCPSNPEIAVNFTVRS